MATSKLFTIYFITSCFLPNLFWMKQLFVTEIKDNYQFYLKLRKERKFLEKGDIAVANTSNNVHYLIEQCNAEHELLPNKIFFIVKVHAKDKRKFEFKLMCKDLYKEPYFRFESYGITHRNNIESIYLPDQQIIPPHFHQFDENGYNIAYKTKELEDEGTAKALEDISLCIAHYCHEGNIRIKLDDFPTIEVEDGKDLFAGVYQGEDDPNHNINFPE